MSNVQQAKPDNDNDHGNDPQTGPNVTIYVDDKPFEIHRGHQLISTIKTVAGVPAVDQLNLEGPDGGIVKLDQNGGITLKGGEHFVSFRATGGSS
jgi:hypothetical protein